MPRDQGNCGCCCKNSCPTIAFSICAIIAACIFSFWCRSFQISSNSVALDTVVPGPEFSIDLRHLHFGPWYQLQREIRDIEFESGQGFTVYTSDSCVDWGFDPEIDTKWKAARAFTILTVVVGTLLTTIVAMADCFRPEHIAPLWKPISMCFLIVLPLFQGLTFLIFRSDACEDNVVANGISNFLQNRTNTTEPFYEDECEWDEGSSANVASIIGWFLAGISMYAFNPAPVAEDNEPRSSKKEEQEEERPEEAPEANEDGEAEQEQEVADGEGEEVVET